MRSVSLLVVVLASAVLLTAEVRGVEPYATTAGLPLTFDIAAFGECLDGPAAAIAPGCSTANFHLDGHVDLLDVAIVQRSFMLAPGPIQLGAETAGMIDPIGDVDEYTFFGMFGISATVDFVTPTVNNRPDLVVRLDLVRPNGTTATSTASCSTTARLDSFVLDATGTWKVRVAVYESWASCGYGADDALRTGLYTLTVCLSNAVPIPIAYGETKTGSFFSDCQIVNYQFQGSVDDLVTVLYFGTAVQRRVQLYGPNGALLVTGGGGQGGGFLDALLPLDGTYRIAVEAADGQATGSFTIGLTELGGATPIGSSMATAGALSRVAEADDYSFEGIYGTTVTVDFVTPSVNNRPDIVSRVDLVRPNGTPATSTASCSATARLDSVVVDAAGTWTVRVRAYEAWYNCGYGPDTDITKGNYTLTVCTSDAPSIPIAYGQSKPGSFTTDCQIVNYAFQGAVGDVVTALYFGTSAARRVQLFGPNGTLLVNGGGGQGGGFVDALLPLDGMYRIAVEVADGQQPGNFTVGLNKLGNATPIALNTPTAGALSQIAEADVYSFNGTFGTSATVDFVTPLVNNRPDIVVRLDLVRPNGTQATSTATCGTTARLDSVVLDATGVWVVRVRAYESWFNCGFGQDPGLTTGNYTLTVGTSNADPIPIAYGQTKQGSFTSDCQIVNYSFNGSVGDFATVLYFGPTPARRVQLYNPNGGLVVNGGGGPGGGFLDASLPLNGTYRIAVEASDGQASGDFSIGLSELSQAVSIAFSTSTPGSLWAVGDADLYSFEGTFGGYVTVDLSTPLVENRPDIVPRLDLVRPNGSLATQTASCGTTARIDVASIDATGTWTVRVRPYESWVNCGVGVDTGPLTGSYTLSVCSSDAAPIPIAYGETKNGNFGTDCQVVNYAFQGSFGDAVALMYAGPAVARRMLLYAPNGTQIAASGGGSCPTLGDIVLPLDGQYRIWVEAADNQATGGFSIGVNKLPAAAPIAFNTPRFAAISQTGEVDVYSFAGTSGTSVTVDFITPNVGGIPDLPVRMDLVRPNGTVATSTASCGTTARLQSVQLDATGTWLARVRAYESWCNCGSGVASNLMTGSYTVTVCNQATCPP